MCVIPKDYYSVHTNYLLENKQTENKTIRENVSKLLFDFSSALIPD